MSGSYDRPTGPPTTQGRYRVEPDAYADSYAETIGPGPFAEQLAPAPMPPPHMQQLQAEPKAQKRGRNDSAPTTAPIVPAGSVTGRSLTLVITIMCFLACLTALVAGLGVLAFAVTRRR